MPGSWPAKRCERLNPDQCARAGSGAIAAGPVGAAAGLVMQGILNKPIGKAVERRYHVTGPWEKPEITQIARSRTGNGARSPRTPAFPATDERPGDAPAREPEPVGEPAIDSGSTPETAPWDVLPPEPASLHRSRL